jgi:hypothetical protein
MSRSAEEWHGFFRTIAPYLSHPLVLIRFALLLFFGVHRSLLRSHLLAPLSAQSSGGVVPVFKILDFDDMGDLWIPDLHGDGGQPCSDVADPVVTARDGEGLGDSFVERFRRHVELVCGVVQVVDNDGAGFRRHDGNLSYSLFVRLLLYASVPSKPESKPLSGNDENRVGVGGRAAICAVCGAARPHR